MRIPQPVIEPPFKITRASHVVLGVKDLSVSRKFYVELIGLVVSDEDEEAVYLRGLEEACHHSLVLRRSKTTECYRVGFRVFTEDDLTKAEAHCKSTGLATSWAETKHQGSTLHVTDPFGIPIEFCARMPLKPRMLTEFSSFKGGSAHRLDHFQILVPDVQAACEFYMAQGFRLSEYIVVGEPESLGGAFLQRKGNPHDIVFFAGAGPRLHHIAFTTIDAGTLLRACDVAGNMHYGRIVEWGPGRHGPGHAQFVYLRDPDGHRVELFTTHYQVMDIENEPIRWDANSKLRGENWTLPAQRAWFEEATPFASAKVRLPVTQVESPTLERFLASRG